MKPFLGHLLPVRDQSARATKQGYRNSGNIYDGLGKVTIHSTVLYHATGWSQEKLADEPDRSVSAILKAILVS